MLAENSGLEYRADSKKAVGVRLPGAITEHTSGGTDMVGLSPEGRGDPSQFLPLKESEPDALEGGRQTQGGGGRRFKRSLQHWGPGRGQGTMRHG